jgi:hypothetical protein
LQSVLLKLPMLWSFLKKVMPGLMLPSEPPLFSAAAHTADSAALAETGLPFSATSCLYCGDCSCAHVVGQALTMLRLQPNETYPP